MTTNGTRRTGDEGNNGVHYELGEKNLSFVLRKPFDVAFENRSVPTLHPGSTDVIIRIKQTGICGSDVHYYSHGAIGKFVVAAPMVLGHESSGIVAAVGSACKTLHIGDRVALEPGMPCRKCTSCKEGSCNLCADMAFAATPPWDGTLVKYYQLAEDFCYKLPEHVSFEEGALVEPLGVAVPLCHRAKIKPASKVVVFGAGPIGLLCCGVAKTFGARTIVCVDLVQARLDLAKESLHATDTFRAQKAPVVENVAQIIKEAQLGAGADIVIDASGAEASIQTGIHILRPGGTYVQGGMGKHNVNFPLGAVIEKEWYIKGSFGYSSGDYSLALSMLEDGLIDLKKLITTRYHFRDAEQAFKDVYSGKSGLIKVMIRGVEDENESV